MLDVASSKQAAGWLEDFSNALARNDVAAVIDLFQDDCYWRDLLTFTWNIKTMEGKDAIVDMLAETLKRAGPTGWQIDGEATVDGDTIEARFNFETGVARGTGIFRLRGGRCRTMFTAMSDLKGFEEKTGRRRPLGVCHRADPN